MINTNIEWPDSTVNPTSGCDGCELLDNGCYAQQVHEHRWAKSLAISHPQFYSARFRDVRLIPGRMAMAAGWSDLRGIARQDKPWIPAHYPRIIFLGDMADIFSRAVPFEFLRDEVITAANSTAGRRHVWMLLTKQAQRLAQFWDWLDKSGVAWPANLRPGVSVTSRANIGRAEILARLGHPQSFISYEPAWELVSFRDVLRTGGIGQIIVGGASGHGAKPFDVRWASMTVADCAFAERACFVKQFGSNCVTANALADAWPDDTLITAHGPGCATFGNVKLRHKKGGDWNEWPPDLRVRQLPALESEAANARV